METNIEQKNDFTKGSMRRNIINMAVPMTVAQLISILYNVVDRIYIARIPGETTLPLTGLGLCLPVISITLAFANRYGMGGAPLCSIARGQGNLKKAEQIMGNSFIMLIITGLVLTVSFLIVKKPLLYLFGASDVTFPYANAYLTIYLFGTIFVMIGTGMNSFINAQGFGRIGMFTTLLGAVANIILDPIFIFVFNLGVQGAAYATIISQALSAVWVLKFLFGPKTILKISKDRLKLRWSCLKNILGLGISAFIMSFTNSLVQIVCNATLQQHGGDLYVGVMTVINSIREIVFMPVTGLTSASQPVISFNYGARALSRVRQGIRFAFTSCVIYTLAIWALLMVFPVFFINIFNTDSQLLELAIPAMHIYFFGFFMMALQVSGQSSYVALGKSKQAIFFSLLRKVIIVVPLTILLPLIPGMGVNGVFMAEPISNFIGGTASFGTLMLTIWPKLKDTTGKGLQPPC